MYKYVKQKLFGSDDLQPTLNYKFMNPYCINMDYGHYCNNPHGSPCSFLVTDHYGPKYPYMNHLTTKEREFAAACWEIDHNLDQIKLLHDDIVKIQKCLGPYERFQIKEAIRRIDPFGVAK